MYTKFGLNQENHFGEKFEDCGLVFGRQGIRVDNPFFDPGFIIAQPLNVEEVKGSGGNWANVSLEYPEALSSGPPINDERIINFDKSLHNVLLNLAKRVTADGEGASKFITINVGNAKTEKDAKKIAFSIANSPLVKTAFAGEDPNWGRIIMAIGKSQINININKINLSLGEYRILEKGELSKDYDEVLLKEYMKNEKIDLNVDLKMGSKKFIAYKKVKQHSFNNILFIINCGYICNLRMQIEFILKIHTI